MNRNLPSNSLSTLFHTSSDISQPTTNTAANGGAATDPHMDRISRQLFELVKHVLQKEALSNTATAAGHDRSSYAQLGISINTNAAADAKVKEVYKHALRVLSSRLTPSVVTDETHLADQVKKKLIREHKSSAKAIRFSNLYGKLSSQPVEQSFAAMGLQNISPAAAPNQRTEDDPRSSARMFGKHRDEDDGSDSSQPSKVSQTSGLTAYRQYLAAGDSAERSRKIILPLGIAMASTGVMLNLLRTQART
ncbi:hypothetical protein BC937DRAFT_87078 [Endogone sp. FLAS-F59071]|nr:hypothetical protein BC937DRAFT_87078 [Endogone sp. FLAS-F59071]|eukprot:RUS19707.1 hypothetical protein BC937DRAFT_87078 [Endogone sp. FLAS-F59071]